MRNRQIGPDHSTAILARLVERLTYKKGWTFELRELNREQGSQGLTLCVAATVEDTYGGPDIPILHYLPVMPAAYDERAWRRWLLDQILLVELHEAMEFLRIDGQIAFPPNHGPGQNPYTVVETQSVEEADRPATPTNGEAADYGAAFA